MLSTRVGDRLKNLATVAAGAFGVTLAVLTVYRLSSEALAILIGVACGVAAAIPTALIIVAARSRRDPPQQQSMITPPMVTYLPQQQQSFPPPPGPGMWQSKSPREFTVLGGDGKGP